MLKIVGYKTTAQAKQWVKFAGILAAILFAASTLVGLLMKCNWWFANGLVIGVVLGAGAGSYLLHFKWKIQHLRPRIALGPTKFIEDFLVEKHAERRLKAQIAKLKEEGREITEHMKNFIKHQAATMLRPEIHKGLKNGKLLRADIKVFGPLAYAIALTAFTLGHFAIPYIVAIGSGLVAGSSLGATIIALPMLVFEKTKRYQAH